MPPVEVSREAVGGRHGELFRRARMNGYVLPVDVWVYAKSRLEVADTRHKLAAALWTEEPAPLYLPDDPGRYYLAVVDGSTDLTQLSDKVHSTTINFRVCDPIAYGKKRSVELANNVPREIRAGGTWEASPIVKSTTAGGTWRIRNLTTGEFVEINADTVGAAIQSGATVICDMAVERVTLNGNDVGATVDSDFFTIAEVTEMKVEGGAGTTVEWRERWL